METKITQPTQGPWRMTPKGKHYSSPVVHGADGSLVASCDSGVAPNEANARLIAAAPALLAFALKCNAGKYGTEDDMLKDSCALVRLATEAK